MTSEEKTTRRDFLKLAGSTAPVAVVALATGAGTASAAAVADVKGAGLPDTEHTRAYLASARF